MGNVAGKLTVCCTGATFESQKGRHVFSAVLPDSLSDGLGHSFCYLHPDLGVPVDQSVTKFSLSGASIGANNATWLSTVDPFSCSSDCSASFESSTSFAALPLQPTPKPPSGPADRGFLSGPIERGLMSDPVDPRRRPFSSPLPRSTSLKERQPVIDMATEGDSNGKLQWAQGKAGEDRVHVVVSEEHKWIFVGIYDGFNGPDAPEFLSSNLYTNIHEELRKLSWIRTDKLHKQVLDSLSRALKKTEDAYFNAADTAIMQNPELALMGSCVLVMLLKGDDVYVMNVGDSRAVLAQKDLNKPNENPWSAWVPKLAALQLSADHSTSVKQEVRRIRREHPEDESAVVNGRVKGSLKVTRAFGVGFLKQPKWNEALLEIFRISYIGTAPYITCAPSLRHYRLKSSDMFLILSSDGLYEYMTNEEAVYEVKLFLTANPEGDPAQHLVEEVLFRAAHKAGLDFHQLLQIPLGDRRRYHDDISVVVISLEGRIWRSSL